MCGRARRGAAIPSLAEPRAPRPREPAPQAGKAPRAASISGPPWPAGAIRARSTARAAPGKSAQPLRLRRGYGGPPMPDTKAVVAFRLMKRPAPNGSFGEASHGPAHDSESRAFMTVNARKLRRNLEVASWRRTGTNSIRTPSSVEGHPPESTWASKRSTTDCGGCTSDHSNLDGWTSGFCGLRTTKREPCGRPCHPFRRTDLSPISPAAQSRGASEDLPRNTFRDLPQQLCIRSI